MLLRILLPLLMSDPGTVPNSDTDRVSVHFQQTIIGQYHPDFRASYTGLNSTLTSEPIKTSITTTFFFGFRLFHNTTLIFNPEMAGGEGFSSTKGIAGFTNGETFRIGDHAPKMYIARALISQRIALGKGIQWQDDDVNQVRGKIPTRYIHLVAGRFAISDYFDKNSYSHDPRTQFYNWSLMSNGAYDYSANTRGYTWGFVAEYISSTWSARFGATMVPTEANLSVFDTHIKQAHGLQFELERRIGSSDRPGVVRLLYFQNSAFMGNYDQALNQNPSAPDIISTRAYGRKKNGFGLNIEKQVSDDIGCFMRASWNDGRNETWMFTEIDQSISGGLVWDGKKWKRPHDVFGVALVMNGISTHHQNYLKAGGYGFMIGDGNLNYSTEKVFETYYKIDAFQEHLFISPDYQFVMNPAYNKDRGPIHAIGLRVQAIF